MNDIFILMGIFLLLLYITKDKKKGRIRFKNSTIPTFYRKNRTCNMTAAAMPVLGIIYNTYLPSNITPVRDQGSCSICWAYSSVAMFNDRYNKKYSTSYIFNPVTLAACCACPNQIPEDMVCTNTCHGNYLDVACDHIVNTGVEIDNFKKSHACNINTIKYKGLSYRRINMDDLDTPDRLIQNEAIICQEIKDNGPVSGIIKVCIDDRYNFYNYRSGIYGADRHISKKDDRFHAVEIVGYGIDKGIRYWYIKNSWGTNWGIKGYIKVIRGINYGSIEADIWVIDI